MHLSVGVTRSPWKSMIQKYFMKTQCCRSQFINFSTHCIRTEERGQSCKLTDDRRPYIPTFTHIIKYGY